MFTVYVSWSLDTSAAPAVDVFRSDTVGSVKAKVGKELGVGTEDFAMYHDGEVLGDMGMAVWKTALVEGSEVEARPSEGFEAREELGRMGLACSVEGLCEMVCRLAVTDEEKARVAQLMIDSGKGIDVAEPMCRAATFGCTEVVRVLARAGDVNKKSVKFFSGSESLPLVDAARCGHLDVVRVLLAHGADVDMADGQRETALHNAARIGNIHIVRELLAHHHHIHSKDITGVTPLHLAAHHNHVPVLEELLAHCRANGTAKTEWQGRTTDDIAAILKDEFLTRQIVSVR